MKKKLPKSPEKELSNADIRRWLSNLSLAVRRLERSLSSIKYRMKEKFNLIENNVHDEIKCARKELDMLMPIYKHLKIRSLPKGCHINHGFLCGDAEPTSQMEYDTWRLEALFLEEKKKEEKR